MGWTGDAVTRTQRHTGRKADNDREDEGLQKNTRLQRRWAGRQKDTKAGQKRDSKRAREPGGRKNPKGTSVRDTAERQTCSETKTGAASGNSRVTEADRREASVPTRAP